MARYLQVEGSSYGEIKAAIEAQDGKRIHSATQAGGGYRPYLVVANKYTHVSTGFFLAADKAIDDMIRQQRGGVMEAATYMMPIGWESPWPVG